ncbi:hypothetical protein [Rahnella bruchi]|uniref:hypothetical protein n=1 Tax=Rahnella bruchi TaxID=1510573 RepID=UPI0013C4FD90|nr:hypothetical protein [Rahnella bruchi]
MKKYTVLVALTFLALTSQLSYAQSTTAKITSSDCKIAFGDSSAHESCNLVAAVAIGDASCQIMATCADADGYPNPTNQTIPYTSVTSLKNCDGWLEVGTCP